MIYWARIGPNRPAPFDIPFLTYSPVATEYNLGFTLLPLLLAGAIASIVASFRKREEWRYLGIVTLAMNLLAYLSLEELISWAFNTPPEMDY